jgi:hypothetical protein
MTTLVIGKPEADSAEEIAAWAKRADAMIAEDGRSKSDIVASLVHIIGVLAAEVCALKGRQATEDIKP